jgi:DNA-binding XRE family transcriptional regulator
MTLSEYMTAHKLDDDAMATLVKADRVTVSRIRRGINRPSWQLAARINAATNGQVPPATFLPEMEAAE